MRARTVRCRARAKHVRRPETVRLARSGTRTGAACLPASTGSLAARARGGGRDARRARPARVVVVLLVVAAVAAIGLHVLGPGRSECVCVCGHKQKAAEGPDGDGASREEQHAESPSATTGLLRVTQTSSTSRWARALWTLSWTAGDDDHHHHRAVPLLEGGVHEELRDHACDERPRAAEPAGPEPLHAGSGGTLCTEAETNTTAWPRAWSTNQITATSVALNPAEGSRKSTRKGRPWKMRGRTSSAPRRPSSSGTLTASTK